MIRLGYNTNQLDKYYQRNMKEAEKVQIPVGVTITVKQRMKKKQFVMRNL